MKHIYNTLEPIVKVHCYACERDKNHYVQIDYVKSTDTWPQHFELTIRNDFYDDYPIYKWRNRIQLFKDFRLLAKQDFRNHIWFTVDFTKKQLKELYDTLYEHYSSNRDFEILDDKYKKLELPAMFDYTEDVEGGRCIRRYDIPVGGEDTLSIEYEKNYSEYIFGCMVTGNNNTQKEFTKYWKKQAWKQLRHPNHNYAYNWFELEETHFIYLLRVLKTLTKED